MRENTGLSLSGSSDFMLSRLAAGIWHDNILSRDILHMAKKIFALCDMKQMP